MKLFVAPIVALAALVAASPSPWSHPKGAKGVYQSSRTSVEQAKGECQTGDIACCNTFSKHDENSLLNLVGKDLLNNLAGNTDASCATTGVLDNLNILGLYDHDESGRYCKNVIACCPAGRDCYAIDGK